MPPSPPHPAPVSACVSVSAPIPYHQRTQTPSIQVHSPLITEWLFVGEGEGVPHRLPTDALHELVHADAGGIGGGASLLLQLVVESELEVRLAIVEIGDLFLEGISNDMPLAQITGLTRLNVIGFGAAGFQNEASTCRRTAGISDSGGAVMAPLHWGRTRGGGQPSAKEYLNASPTSCLCLANEYLGRVGLR